MQGLTLHMACLGHHLERVSQILNNSDLSVRLVDANGKTPLHYLCAISLSDVYDGDASDTANSVLQRHQIAFIENFTEILNLLIAHDLDINAKSDNGTLTAFLICCSNGDEDKYIANLLMEAVLLLTGKLDIYGYFPDEIDTSLSFGENIEGLFRGLLSDVAKIIANLFDYYNAEDSSINATLAQWLLHSHIAQVDAIIDCATRLYGPETSLPSRSNDSFSPRV